MQPTVAILLVLAICVGCRRAAPPATAQTQIPLATSSDASLTADEVFKRLTAFTWTTKSPEASQLTGSDYSVSTFAADGSWSTQHVTDYQIPARRGRWNLQQAAGGAWYLCLDDGHRDRVELNSYGTLTLANGRLYSDKPLNPDSKLTAKTLPPLSLLPEVQIIIDRLTAHSWKRANDLDLRMEPTHVRFSRDWSFVATYREGQCTSKGTWYATVDAVSAANPAGRCDDRPGTGGDQFTAEVIDERRILINHDLYVPDDQAIKRGVIWGLFGYDEARRVRFEYDMPIRKGVPVRFDVTITNRLPTVLTLERFSLGRSFSDYGRHSGGTKMFQLPSDEIAGIDLQSIVLQPEKSYSFAIEATFRDPGRQFVYFNALVTGIGQNWDSQSAHELDVHSP